jgi:hypothetical protein
MMDAFGIGLGKGGTEVMSRSTYFVQECPTCGRSLQVRVEYLGRQVMCQHCHGSFEAYDPANSREVPAKTPPSLLHRADQLLESIGQHRHPPVA